MLVTRCQKFLTLLCQTQWLLKLTFSLIQKITEKPKNHNSEKLTNHKTSIKLTYLTLVSQLLRVKLYLLKVEKPSKFLTQTQNKSSAILYDRDSWKQNGSNLLSADKTRWKNTQLNMQMSGAQVRFGTKIHLNRPLDPGPLKRKIQLITSRVRNTKISNKQSTYLSKTICKENKAIQLRQIQVNKNLHLKHQTKQSMQNKTRLNINPQIMKFLQLISSLKLTLDSMQDH